MWKGLITHHNFVLLSIKEQHLINNILTVKQKKKTLFHAPLVHWLVDISSISNCWPMTLISLVRQVMWFWRQQYQSKKKWHRPNTQNWRTWVEWVSIILIKWRCNTKHSVKDWLLGQHQFCLILEQIHPQVKQNCCCLQTQPITWCC